MNTSHKLSMQNKTDHINMQNIINNKQYYIYSI